VNQLSSLLSKELIITLDAALPTIMDSLDIIPEPILKEELATAVVLVLFQGQHLN
jgi:hypothetical protein